MALSGNGLRRRRPLTLLALGVAAIAAALASPAKAAPGYELDATTPVHSTGGVPRSMAIDQSNQDIYIAIFSNNSATGTPGEIDRLNGDLSPDGVFAPGGGYYTGVAVDPTTHGFYASQIKFDLPTGSFGTARMDRFTPDGTLAGSFPLADAGSFPPIAADSAGNVFYPNSDGHTVQVFNSAGVLQQEITCGGCPGGAFGRPISIAIDAADNLYVADVSPDRVVKLTPSGGSYTFASTLQSGLGAVAVGVDPGSGDVLVGDLPGGRNYHIVAYNSAGVQFDDFGGGLFPDPLQDPPGAATNLGYQMTVNGTTHELYVPRSQEFYIFEKTTIAPPGGEAKPASNVGQLTARLNVTLNVHGHTALSCVVEYTDAADTGFTHATSLPCPENPVGPDSTALAIDRSGLLPATGYRYRAKVSTYGGSFTSNSETFETLPLAPSTVTTEAPQGLTQTSATLRGTVNPQGGSPSDCHFELGTSLSYGTNRSCTSLPGPVSSNVAVNRSTPGLTAGTTYHYRLVFTTNAGTVMGKDVEFKTISPPAEPEPEGSPSADQPIAPVETTPAPFTPPVTPRRPLRCKKGFRKARVRGKVRCVKRRKRHHSRHKHS